MLKRHAVLLGLMLFITAGILVCAEDTPAEGDAPVTGEMIPYLAANGLFGFVSPDGTMLIPPRYADVQLYSEGLAAVAVKDKSGIIDKRGVVWGVIDTKGRWVAKPKYSEIEPYKNGEAKATYMTPPAPSWYMNLLSGFPQGAWHEHVDILDHKGRILQNDDGDSKIELPAPVAAVAKNGNFEVGYPAIGPLPLYLLGQCTALAGEDSSRRSDASCLMAFFNADGKALTPFIYRLKTIAKFSDDRLAVWRDGYWGFIDGRGEEVIPCKFDDVSLKFTDGYARVSVRGRGVGIIDTQGRVVVDFSKYQAINPDGDRGYYMVQGKKGKGIINVVTGREVVPLVYPSWDDLMIISKGSTQIMLAVRNSSKLWSILDAEGKTLRCCYSVVSGAHENMMVVRKTTAPDKNGNWHWGAIDAWGRDVIPLDYDQISSFSSQGLARVYRDGVSFFIDTHGHEYRAATP